MIKWVIIGIAIFLFFTVMGFPILFLNIYSKKKYNKRADTDYIFDLKDFSNLDYKRADFYNNQGQNIRAYKFFQKDCIDSHAVILLIPGFKNNHNKYLPEIDYFVNRGYCVFSFDPTYTGKSQGNSLIGLYQIPYDAQCAVSAIKADASLNTKPLLLWGYSNGGYAALSLINNDITAVAALSAFDNVNQMTADHGVRAFGKKAKIVYPYVAVYNRLKYGKTPFKSAKENLNSYDIPVFLAHSVDDEVVPYSNFEKLKKYNTHHLSVNLSLEGRSHWIRYEYKIQLLRDKLEARLEKAQDNDKHKVMCYYAGVSKKIDYNLVSQAADFYDRVLDIKTN